MQHIPSNIGEIFSRRSKTTSKHTRLIDLSRLACVSITTLCLLGASYVLKVVREVLNARENRKSTAGRVQHVGRLEF